MIVVRVDYGCCCCCGWRGKVKETIIGWERKIKSGGRERGSSLEGFGFLSEDMGTVNGRWIRTEQAFGVRCICRSLHANDGIGG